MVEVFARVLARRLGKFAEDRVLTEMQGVFRSIGDVWICEVMKREKKNSYLAFLGSSKAYTVWVERDYGKR